MLKDISKTIPVETDNQARIWLKRGSDFFTWNKKSQDINFALVIRYIQGWFVEGGGQSEQFAWSNRTTSARECKLCRVGNRYPSVGALEDGNLRSGASRFHSGLFSRLQAAILVLVSYLEDYDAPVFSCSYKRVNISIRASPFDPKGLTFPPHWESGFNIRTQYEHRHLIDGILAHRHTSME